MEIGPMGGVRAISLLDVHRTPGELPTVFEIDASSRADDKNGSPAPETPDRGLEEEDSSSSNEDDDREMAASRPATIKGAGISFFA